MDGFYHAHFFGYPDGGDVIYLGTSFLCGDIWYHVEHRFYKTPQRCYYCWRWLPEYNRWSRIRDWKFKAGNWGLP